MLRVVVDDPLAPETTTVKANGVPASPLTGVVALLTDSRLPTELPLRLTRPPPPPFPLLPASLALLRRM